MSTAKTLSLEEILPGSSVRFTDDGMLYAVDLVMAITDKNRDEAGMVLRRLPEEIFNPKKLIERKTPGKGNARTKLVSFNDALELIMVLPGKMARDTRVKFADIIKRYLAGDSSLVGELANNAESAHPIHGLARQSLAQDKSSHLEMKRRREQLEIENLELDILQKKTCIETQIIANRAASIANEAATIANTAAIDMHVHANREAGLASMLKFETTMSTLRCSTALDERTRLSLEDMTKNDFMDKRNLKMITESGDDTPASGWNTISISEVAKEMGIKGPISTKMLQAVGLDLGKLYRAKYDKAPDKHSQFVDGAERKVNSYTTKDRDLMEQAIQLHFEV